MVINSQRLLVVVTLLFAHLFATVASANSRIIREADFGEAWPFLVSQGELSCTRGSRVTFTANDIIYAVNGTAVSAGFAPIEPIWKLDYALIEEISKAFGITPEQYVETETLVRISISPIIEAGLALCGE